MYCSRSAKAEALAKTPAASENRGLVDQLCEAILSKLIEHFTGPVALNQPVRGSSPLRLIS